MIGFVFLADALVCVVVVTALAWTVGQVGGPSGSTTAAMMINLYGDDFNANALDRAVIDPGTADILHSFNRLFGKTPAEVKFIVGLFVFSTCVALLGAFFFFANSLWDKLGDPKRDPFDRAIFWAGLWFRLAEAVLFNLVFFLLLRIYVPDQYLLLPLVSLLVGMFLKAGEVLVSGFANRVFAAFAALVPTERGAPAPLKLAQWKLLNLPEDVEARDLMIRSVVRAIAALRGAEVPIVDPKAAILRLRYDADRLSPEQVQQTMQLLGLQFEGV